MQFEKYDCTNTEEYVLSLGDAQHIRLKGLFHVFIWQFLMLPPLSW